MCQILNRFAYLHIVTWLLVGSVSLDIEPKEEADYLDHDSLRQLRDYRVVHESCISTGTCG